MPNKIPTFKPKGLRAAKRSENRGTAAQRGYDARWRRLRDEALRRWVQERGPYCGICGAVLDFGRATHLDHIEPHGGQDDPKFWLLENLQAICQPCHTRKTKAEQKDPRGGM